MRIVTATALLTSLTLGGCFEGPPGPAGPPGPKGDPGGDGSSRSRWATRSTGTRWPGRSSRTHGERGPQGPKGDSAESARGLSERFPEKLSRRCKARYTRELVLLSDKKGPFGYT